MGVEDGVFGVGIFIWSQTGGGVENCFKIVWKTPTVLKYFLLFSFSCTKHFINFINSQLLQKFCACSKCQAQKEDLELDVFR